MGHLPHKTHNNSIWTWSVFHLKNWLGPKNTKNPVKSIKMKILKKKHLEGPHQWTCVTNWVQIGIFLGIELFQFCFCYRLTNIFVIGYFVVQKVWKAHKNFFRSIGGNKLWNFDTLIHPSDVYKLRAHLYALHILNQCIKTFHLSHQTHLYDLF